MRITIVKINVVDSNVFVDFSTEYGEAIALWEGEIPTAGLEYYVEIDVEDTLVWNKDITRNESEECSLKMLCDKISLAGILDSVDCDGYSVLRMGNNIVPFFSSGKQFEVGSPITVLLKSLSLSPVSY